MQTLIAGVGLLFICGAAVAFKTVRDKRRQLDERSDVTKLVLSAGQRRKNTKAEARFMGKR